MAQTALSRTQSVQAGALTHLAQTTIALSRLAPQLDELAAHQQAGAEAEAIQARDMARLAREMSRSLAETISALHDSTREIGELAELIRRVADQTSLIAVNTGIAASKVTEGGEVFQVLAQEIHRLSEGTSRAARDVGSKIRRLEDSAEDAAKVVGLAGRTTRKDVQAGGLQALLHRMVETEARAQQRAAEAKQLSAVGHQLRIEAEAMMRSVGRFRLDAHERAEAVALALRQDARLASLEDFACTAALRSAIAGNPFIQLAYATDLRGTQVSENVSRGAFHADYGDSGIGRDWSDRPWFRGALQQGGVFTSEIYRSAATGEFCLTVSTLFGPEGGEPRGVVALDLDFRQLLG